MSSVLRSISRVHRCVRPSKALRCTSSRTQRRSVMTIMDKMCEVVPREQERVFKLMKRIGDESLGEITVKQAAGGMRGIKGLICETSELDIDEGIRFRGLSIPEIQEQLPNASCRGLPGESPLPEGLLWLLLTGEVPSDAEVKLLSEELTSEPRTTVSKHVRDTIDSLPQHQHPMSQFATAILALQAESRFAKAYEEGVNRSQYWHYVLDDVLDMVARIPYISARIFRNVFRDGIILHPDRSLDWSANWCTMINKPNPAFQDLMRMYFTIHSDHEGGNVSAHAGHLIGSALSDPYLSFAGALCGLAGPLHGLANQECLRFINGIVRKVGSEPTEDEIRTFIIQHLESGQVVPGFGHAVLRKTDPRYLVQREFALKHLPDDPIFAIVDKLYRIVPEILKDWKGGRVANPYPNVDAHSGCLLQHYDLTEEHFFTVLFGMSRAIGVGAQLTLDRAYYSPIERPKSLTTARLEEMFPEA